MAVDDEELGGSLSVEDDEVDVAVEVVVVEVDVAVAVRCDVPAETGCCAVVGAAAEVEATASAGARTVTSVRGARDEEGDVPRGTA